ncbi:hypothetical protein CONPUDRAFT_78392 [Coniophora puteana RWD-64-598 SS2]|uniref:Uncharacterized protein n=1 Tax=Coniophora puteana (strain RWD-64-598) TaxID=741705 RepID=R7SDJ9_CONPW|nr:uncharacterized protein CONPUDRAFT_78392 [Coniophora puteana RWD-64-598 SS2]EIW73955.1 hypothetical protein CONPUDRAFT_78392 [Coniophora puteana RWD-64-598 SS2]
MRHRSSSDTILQTPLALEESPYPSLSLPLHLLPRRVHIHIPVQSESSVLANDAVRTREIREQVAPAIRWDIGRDAEEDVTAVDGITGEVDDAAVGQACDLDAIGCPPGLRPASVARAVLGQGVVTAVLALVNSEGP